VARGAGLVQLLRRDLQLALHLMVARLHGLVHRRAELVRDLLVRVYLFSAACGMSLLHWSISVLLVMVRCALGEPRCSEDIGTPPFTPPRRAVSVALRT